MLVGPESCTSAQVHTLWPPSVVSVNLCRWQCAHAKLFPIFSKHLHIHILQRKKYLQSLSLLFPARYREKKSILDFLGICLGRGFFEPFALAGNFADAHGVKSCSAVTLCRDFKLNWTPNLTSSFLAFRLHVGGWRRSDSKKRCVLL